MKNYETDHMWHAIAAVLTGGMWIPGWIGYTLYNLFNREFCVGVELTVGDK